MFRSILLWCSVFLLLQDAVHGNYQQAGDVAEKVDLHYKDKRLYHNKKDPMKIIVHYDASIDRMDKAEKAIIKCSLIPSAVEWVSKVIKVHKSGSKFLLERQCLNNYHYLINGKKYCQNGCMAETKCGPVTIPEKHLHGCNSCNSGTDCTTRPANEKHTLKGDFVLYVSSLPDLLCQRYYLSASHCQQEKDFDRPVAGYLNFCPGLLIDAQSAYDPLLTVVMHEMLHMLAFSHELLPYFRDEQGLPRTARDSSGIPITEGHWSSNNYKVNGASLTKITKQKWTTVNNVYHTVTIISTPNVQREVRKHFQCINMIGAEMENQEQTVRGTIHWEKRLFGNELMTADYSPNSVISKVTLALLVDSGWYGVNYSYAGWLAWGEGKGCAFVNSTCGEWIQQSQNQSRNPSPFCDGKSHANGDYECTINHKAIGSCNMKNFSYLPTEYQYFNKNVFAGGSLPSADYCPFNQEIRSLGEFLQCNNIYAPKGVKYIVGLESYGSKSACFEHGKKWVQKIQHKKDEQLIETQRQWGAGCYEYMCTDKSIVITVGNSEFECKKPGKTVRISTTYDGLVYEGSLICPEYDKLCQAHSCSNMCSRHGSCINDTCYCDPGFYGSDCRHSHKANSKTCKDITCENGGTCMDDDTCGVTCNCSPQYTGSHCEQQILQDLCELDKNYCNGHGECIMSSNRSVATCQCHEGFTGTRCDVQQDYCTLHGNPCQNGATCVSSSFNSFYCRCPGRYSGILCKNENDYCITQPCKNGGTCINKPNGYSCQCTQWYTGRKCRHRVNDPCSPNPCHNEGICLKNNTGFTCNCPPPYSGVTCTEKERYAPYTSTQCTNDSCFNGGTCVESENKFYCACLQDYTGSKCETQIIQCIKNACQNATQCKTNSSNNNRNNCQCSDVNCNKSNICDSTKCLNGGTCIEEKNTYHCNCTSPYSGERCEKGPCNPNPCKNGGKCSVKDGEFDCRCPPMFKGKRCKKVYTPQSMPCPLETCDNGGVCKILPNNTQQCECPPHLKGSYCSKEKNPCLNHECRNNGRCIPIDHNDYLCNCSNGYRGRKCEQSDECNECKTNPCKNGGECACNGENGYQCVCPKGFEGNQCQLETQSYTLPPCTSCLNITNCTTNTNSSCACKSGYTGHDCEHRVSCASKPCQNGGTCFDTDSSFNCSCPVGFTGKTCNTSLHTSKCLNGVKQTTVLHAIEMCICMQGFSGTRCQYDNSTNPCIPNKCVHGSCIVQDDAYACRCSEGFTGRHCDEPDYCNLGYCMNGATCIYNDDQTFKCLCTEKFTGEFCTVYKH